VRLGATAPDLWPPHAKLQRGHLYLFYGCGQIEKRGLLAKFQAQTAKLFLANKERYKLVGIFFFDQRCND
jgi:hypothetical protein